MAITLTSYIYPLKAEIVLSKHLGYSIDNPRTEEEIQFIKDYIGHALRRHWEASKPHHNPILSAAFAISKWGDFMKHRDEYAHSRFSTDLEVEAFIAQSWVILRYKDNGEFEKANKDIGVFFDIFFTDKRHAYWQKYNDVLSYCQLISLLCHD